MNISMCSQSRAFMDDAAYQPQPYPADRRYPVPNPGYDTYPNTGYPGVRTIYTAFGPTTYADSEVLSDAEIMAKDVDGRALELPPLTFLNGQPTYTPAPKSTQPLFASAESLNHLTMIPLSGHYNKISKPPTVDICRDYWSNGMVVQDAEKVETSIWGNGSDFVLRRPMPSMFINGVPATGPEQGGGIGLLGVAAIVAAVAFLHSR